MNTDELTNTRYLVHGDVVTIDDKKYLCEQHHQMKITVGIVLLMVLSVFY